MCMHSLHETTWDLHDSTCNLHETAWDLHDTTWDLQESHAQTKHINTTNIKYIPSMNSS